MNTIAMLVTITRELRSIENRMQTNITPGLRRTLSTQYQRYMDARLRVVTEQLNQGTDALTLTWICQHASDRDLMNLYCDRDADHLMIAQANRMILEGTL